MESRSAEAHAPSAIQNTMEAALGGVPASAFCDSSDTIGDAPELRRVVVLAGARHGDGHGLAPVVGEEHGEAGGKDPRIERRRRDDVVAAEVIRFAHFPVT